MESRMSFAQQAETAAHSIEAEIGRRKRDSKAKTELIGLLNSFHNCQRDFDPEESNRQWLESLDDAFYSGIPANKRFLKKVCFPFDRDIESPIKS